VGRNRYLIYLNELTSSTLIIFTTTRQAKEGTMPTALARPKRGVSVFASIVAWCDDRFRDILAPLVRAGRSAGQTSDAVGNAHASGEAPDPPRYHYDASLLFRRMAAMQIDRDELASDDPLLFGELQALCTLCRSKERCVLDLDQEGSNKAGKRDWREYCLNATTLNALGAVQNCARARLCLRTPRSTGHLQDQ
jgi:hypothetical protein